MPSCKESGHYRSHKCISCKPEYACGGTYSPEADDLVVQRDRLLVLATKWCDTTHHDWDEILDIAEHIGA